MASKLQCPNGHAMQQLITLQSGKCHTCEKSGELVMMCPVCQYGLCGGCALRSSMSRPNQQPPAPTQPTTNPFFGVQANCPSGHPMTERLHSQDWNCDRCRELNKGGTRRSLRCDVCDYDVCENCLRNAQQQLQLQQLHRDPTAAALPACAKGHAMQLMNHGVVWRCDVCQQQYPPGTKRSFRCETCDFDRCESCWPAQNSQPPPPTQNLTKAPVQAPQVAPPPVQHPFVPPSLAPPAQPQGQPQAQTNQPQVLGSYGSSPIVTCPYGHPLQVELHRVPWNCDGCKQAYAASSKRSLRCPTCDFDLCDTCWFYGPGKTGPAAPMPTPLPSWTQQPARPNPPNVFAGPPIQQQPSLPSFGAPPPPPSSVQPAGAQAPPLGSPIPGHFCQKGHALVSSRHTERWCCDVCRTSLEGNTIPSLRCAACDFDVCDSCVRKQTGQGVPLPPAALSAPVAQPYVPKCRAGHILKQTTHKRSWRCDGCLRTLSTGWEASMHCPICIFDLCSRCVRPPPPPPPAVTPTQQKAPLPAPNTAPPGKAPFPPPTWTQQKSAPPPQYLASAPNGNGPQPIAPFTASLPGKAPQQQPPIFGHQLSESGVFGGPWPAGGATNWQLSAAPAPAGPPVTQQPFTLTQSKLTGQQPGTRSRSLFIGINYRGSDVELQGCVNDVAVMMQLLTAVNFDITDRQVLVDDAGFAGRTGHPDRQSILQAMQWLVRDAKPGDNLFLHYSGHGAQVPDQDGDEDDGYDETLIPADYQQSGQIRDDEINRLLCQSLPAGVRLTAVMDCCHSGSVLDLEYEWHSERSRIPLRRSRRNPEGEGGARAGGGGFEAVNRKRCAGDVVLFSGCKDSQTSADVRNIATFKHDFNHPGTAGGACTNALAEIVQGELRRRGSISLTYIQVLDSMQEHLAQRRFTQIPQLSTSRPIDLQDRFSFFGSM